MEEKYLIFIVFSFGIKFILWNKEKEVFSFFYEVAIMNTRVVRKSDNRGGDI